MKNSHGEINLETALNDEPDTLILTEILSLTVS